MSAGVEVARLHGSTAQNFYRGTAFNENARSKGQIMNVFRNLHRNTLVNSVVKNLRINRLVDAYLGRLPIKRKTSNGFVYEIESVPSMVVANEIFSTDDYLKPVSQIRPKTFVDLGANVGYFPVLVAEIMKSRAIKGLCIEPNPTLHPMIEFHLRANDLKEVYLLKGVVADAAVGPEVDFFLNPSHIASSVMGRFNPRFPVGGAVRKIRVPVIDIIQEWRKNFDGDRVDILKIDIEGAEVGFLKDHSSFLAIVDAVVVEWHSWVTTLEEVRGILSSAGFSLEHIGHQDEHAGTAFFLRKA
jgi:FkbM family methyltransferase